MRAEQPVRIVHGPVQQSPAFIVGDRVRIRSTQRIVFYIDMLYIGMRFFNAVTFHSVSFVYAVTLHSVGLAATARVGAAVLGNLIDDLFALDAGLAGDPLFVPHGQSPTSCLG